MKSIINILVPIALASACDGTADVQVSEDDARRVAEDAVGGTALTAELERDGNPPHWAIALEMSNGGEIEARVHANEGHLVELEAFEGPYDYAFTPVDGVFAFEDMMASALDEISGEVVAWKFFVAADSEYIFEFYIRDPGDLLWEILFDAADGRATDIEQVAEVHE